METERPTEIANVPPAKRRAGPPSELLWAALILWFGSFFSPAARYMDWGHEKTMFGWEAAFTALVFLVVPIKGMWFGFDPHVWTVLANFFMLWAPFEVKRLRTSKARTFTILFTLGAATAVGLLFIPDSIDLASIRAFELGFVLWTLSLLAASAWFTWTIWGKRAVWPQILLGAVLFCGLFVWSPYLKGQQNRAQKEHEQALQQMQVQQQRQAERKAALDAIAQHGLLAFSEPLTDTQEIELEFRINRIPLIPPDQLIAASEHYQNPKIMMSLANLPTCPAHALEIIHQHTATKEERNDPSLAATVMQLYMATARNPNATSDLLLKMLASESPAQRAAAVRSGKLSAGQKRAYLAKGCTFTDDYELNAIASDPDTPVEVLECLATKPGASNGLSFNPHTPTSVLEEMSQSKDWRIANGGKLALSQRRQQDK